MVSKSTSASYEEMTVMEWLVYMQAKWRQGQHITLLGPTGTGKTTVAGALVSLRRYTVVLATKNQDETLEAFRKAGFTVIKRWPPYNWQHHVVLWLKPKSLDRRAVAEQIEQIHSALNDIYLSGGWCLFLDEAGYLATTLKQGMEVGMLMSQARSSGISVVCGIQRPHSISAQIPLEILNQAKHHIFFKYDDLDEIRHCARIAGISYEIMIYYMQEMRVYHKGFTDFLYIGNGRTVIVRAA